MQKSRELFLKFHGFQSVNFAFLLFVFVQNFSFRRYRKVKAKIKAAAEKVEILHLKFLYFALIEIFTNLTYSTSVCQENFRKIF